MTTIDTLPLSSRLAGMTASVTGALAARAKDLRASGVPVANFAAGELDLPTPEVIVEAAREAALDPRLHHYGPAAGLPELREAIAAHHRPSGATVRSWSPVVRSRRSTTPSRHW